MNKLPQQIVSVHKYIGLHFVQLSSTLTQKNKGTEGLIQLCFILQKIPQVTVK